MAKSTVSPDSASTSHSTIVDALFRVPEDPLTKDEVDSDEVELLQPRSPTPPIPLQKSREPTFTMVSAKIKRSKWLDSFADDPVAIQDADTKTKNAFLFKVFVGIFLELGITVSAVYLLTSEHFVGTLQDVPVVVYLVLSSFLFLLGVIVICSRPETFTTGQLILLNAWSVALMTVLTSLLIVWVQSLYMLYAQVGTLCVVLIFIFMTAQPHCEFQLHYAFLFCILFDATMGLVFLYRPYMDFWDHPSELWLNPPTDILRVLTILILLLIYQGYLLLNLRIQMQDVHAQKRPLYVVFRLYLDIVKVMYCFNGGCCDLTKARR
jgi:hypothetical protein